MHRTPNLHHRGHQHRVRHQGIHEYRCKDDIEHTGNDALPCRRQWRARDYGGLPSGDIGEGVGNVENFVGSAHDCRNFLVGGAGV
jgi:hypothetical protein